MTHHRTALLALLLTLSACAQAPKPQPTITRYYSDPSHHAARLAELAPQFLPVRAAADPYHQIVTVEGSPPAVESAIEFFDKLGWTIDDGPGSFRHLFIRRLHNARAADLAAILTTLNQKHAFDAVPSAPIPNPTHITFDADQNALIIETSAVLEEKLRRLIDSLDQPAPETRP